MPEPSDFEPDSRPGRHETLGEAGAGLAEAGGGDAVAGLKLAHLFAHLVVVDAHKHVADDDAIPVLDQHLIDAPGDLGVEHDLVVGADRAGKAFDQGQGTAPRLMLHAAKLDLPHPEGGRLVIEAPLPEDFRRAAEAAGLQAGL